MYIILITYRMLFTFVAIAAWYKTSTVENFSEFGKFNPACPSKSFLSKFNYNSSLCYKRFGHTIANALYHTVIPKLQLNSLNHHNTLSCAEMVVTSIVWHIHIYMRIIIELNFPFLYKSMSWLKVLLLGSYLFSI